MMPMYKPPKRRKLTKEERQSIYDKCGGHCAYCGRIIEFSEMQADHVIPMEFYDTYKTMGIDLDTVKNMLPACRSCNNYKDTLTLDKFRKAIELWPEVLERNNATYRNAVRFGMVFQNPHPVKFYFEKIGLKLEDDADA